MPPAVMVSMTREPESDDVTKRTITRTMPTNEVMPARGRLPSMVNSFSSNRRVGDGLHSVVDQGDRGTAKRGHPRTETIDGSTATQTMNSARYGRG